MLASYGPIARRSAAITAGAALIMVVLSTILGGAKGLTGSLLSDHVDPDFNPICISAVWMAAKVSPQAMMITAIVSYLVKILVLIFLSAKFSDTTAFNGKLFGLTAILCVLVWSFAQVLWSMMLKVLYVEPDGVR